jgi:hypothetical protein
MKSLTRIGSVLVLLAVATVACEEDLPVGSDDGGVTKSDGGAPARDSGSADGGSCVDINAADYPTSCSTSSDCTRITSGSVCDGTCNCGDTPVNEAGYAKFEQAVSGIQFGECGCPAFEVPQCVNNVCVVPGQEVDGGAPRDAGSCVDINPASYPTSCTQASDCGMITAGTLCDGDCNCGGTAANKTGVSEFDQAVSGIQFGVCGCPAFLTPECVNNQCVLPGTHPVDAGTNPPSCPASYSDEPGSCGTSGEECYYPQGNCICSVINGGPATDAGPNTTPSWNCIPLPPGCPEFPPAIGTSCTLDSSTTCDYGECTSVGRQCVDGKWASGANDECPV